MSQLQLNSRAVVYKLIAQVTGEVTPLASSTAEICLAVGRQGLDTPAMFNRIVNNSKAAKPYQPENPSFVAEPLPGTSIVVGNGPWLEALAVLAAQKQMPRQEIEILEAHANDPSIHDQVSLPMSLSNCKAVDDLPRVFAYGRGAIIDNPDARVGTPMLLLQDDAEIPARQRPRCLTLTHIYPASTGIWSTWVPA